MKIQRDEHEPQGSEATPLAIYTTNPGPRILIIAGGRSYDLRSFSIDNRLRHAVLTNISPAPAQSARL